MNFNMSLYTTPTIQIITTTSLPRFSQVERRVDKYKNNLFFCLCTWGNSLTYYH